MDLEHEIEEVIKETAAEGGKRLVGDFGSDTVLLQSGLDSLDFAIVVARLEEKLDADPFTVAAKPLYPRTFGEFVRIYEEYLANSK